MFHFKGDFEGKLYKSLIMTVFEPRALIDQFFDTILFDGVNILLTPIEHLLKFAAGRLGVAIQQALADQGVTAVAFKGLCGFIVHIYDRSLTITNSHSTGKLLEPI